MRYATKGTPILACPRKRGKVTLAASVTAARGFLDRTGAARW